MSEGKNGRPACIARPPCITIKTVHVLLRHRTEHAHVPMGGDAQALELGQPASRERAPGLGMRRGLPRRSRGEADGADLLRRNARNRCCRRVSCRLPVKKHLERVTAASLKQYKPGYSRP